MSASASSTVTRITTPSGEQAKTSTSQGCVAGVAYTLTISGSNVDVTADEQAVKNKKKTDKAILFISFFLQCSYKSNKNIHAANNKDYPHDRNIWLCNRKGWRISPPSPISRNDSRQNRSQPQTDKRQGNKQNFQLRWYFLHLPILENRRQQARSLTQAIDKDELSLGVIAIPNGA